MKIRVKFRQMPGDISKKEKIDMLENRANQYFGWLWKNVMKPRARAVEKERARDEINDIID